MLHELLEQSTITLPSGGLAWGLSDVATIRWLQPGEAFVTPRGAFHWFAFSHARPTCAQIVVSPESADLVRWEP